MATTTPNNGWAVPTSTDLVKDGAVAIETLGDAIDASVGTGLLAWTSYTPTLTATTTNPTIGNSVWDAAYCKIGKTVHVRIKLTLGSTFAVGSGAYVFSLPIAPKSGTEYPVSCVYVDASLSNVYRVTALISSGQINRSYYADGGGAVLGAAAPVVPANTDVYRYAFSYEVA